MSRIGTLPFLLTMFKCYCLLLAKPFPDRVGFFLIFLQYLGNILPGFCHGKGTALRIVSGLERSMLGRRSSRASASSSASNSAACAFSFRYCCKADSSSAAYFLSCSSGFFRAASMEAIFFFTSPMAASSAQSRERRSIAFSERSSSMSSESVAICFANSCRLAIFHIGTALRSSSRRLR